ncbi:hypothetical protein BX600DRAFT_450757 [Xylariales sp. PMI_506]|nr:hypothetical protein BX600DRAFT_450757 [Xylariales sp. PMI_506]
MNEHFWAFWIPLHSAWEAGLGFGQCLSLQELTQLPDSVIQGYSQRLLRWLDSVRHSPLGIPRCFNVLSASSLQILYPSKITPAVAFIRCRPLMPTSLHPSLL